MPPGDQRIAFGIIAGTATLGEIVRCGTHVVELADDTVIRISHDGDVFTLVQVQPLHIVEIHQQHTAGAIDAPVAIFVAVDGGVELIVAAQRE
jgi:hypothetical protein